MKLQLRKCACGFQTQFGCAASKEVQFTAMESNKVIWGRTLGSVLFFLLRRLCDSVRGYAFENVQLYVEESESAHV